MDEESKINRNNDDKKNVSMKIEPNVGLKSFEGFLSPAIV